MRRRPDAGCAVRAIIPRGKPIQGKAVVVGGTIAAPQRQPLPPRALIKTGQQRHAR
ncbi:hypothetical protein [Acerihabitans arboris]|uniref:Uncharacterized protein n=1 Tax=Acerihabitans arboris TaxID=2691583 RepID=A0A845SJ28_9GAMM|nr:hypothetical protein [Acerihabitans arboris]NDL62974.1 hypothetical protein [Acerihabitans arboris]